MNEIKIGDTVRIRDTGACYPSYTQWFERNAPQYLSLFKGNEVYRGLVGEVVAIAPHAGFNDWYCLLYAVQSNEGFVVLCKSDAVVFVDEGISNYLIKGR